MSLSVRVLMGSMVALLVASCANIGRPTGGLIDITPPRLVKSTPMPNQTSFNKNKIELEFDEIVLVENASEKVNVSPPQKNVPEITTNGRRVQVLLKDTLHKNTTYTIDFSDAIVDNNEKNPFSNFALSFSTGTVIDSLDVAGTVLNAADLEPVTGISVGLHKLLDDSAFTRLPFVRVTRTDDRGRFRIRNVAAGRYRLYALKDANRDYKFDQPSEDLAYSDSIIVPSFEYYQGLDSVHYRKGKVIKDTVAQVQKKRFLPDHIVLRAFNENFKSQYIDKVERKQRNKLSLTFAAAAKQLPDMRPLNFQSKNWCVLERSATNDTLHYWLRDSLIYQHDTLLIEARYLKTDSLKRLMPQTDTLKFVFHDPKISAKKKKKDDAAKIEKPSLVVDARISPTPDVTDDLLFTMPVPLDSIAYGDLHLEEKKDSLWKPVRFDFRADSLNIRLYRLHCKWTPDREYRLRIDSAAFLGINKLSNPPMKKTFRVKNLEQYGALFLKVNGLSGDAFVELLSESDKPLRKEPVLKGSAEFYYLNPGTYYARLVIDKNSNFKWDTGNYAKKLQPEEVYYYNSTFEIRANWDVEQEWSIQSLPLEEQKPLKLVKNKPKEKKRVLVDQPPVSR